MAFLIPSYTRATFVRVTHKHGVDVFERIDFSDAKIHEMFDVDDQRCEIETISGKWWGRLTAPGYLDCTEWNGPHDTHDEARVAIRDEYNVDPDTGEDLPDEDDDAADEETFAYFWSEGGTQYRAKRDNAGDVRLYEKLDDGSWTLRGAHATLADAMQSVGCGESDPDWTHGDE